MAALRSQLTLRAFLALPPSVRVACRHSSTLSTLKSFFSSTTVSSFLTGTSVPPQSAHPPPPRPSQTASTPPPTPSSAAPPSSVNPSEVSHFNALASSWWDPHGPSRLLHLMNPHRHTFIRACLSSTVTPPPPDQRLKYLDIGCGGGIFAESAARLPSTLSVTAIDPSPEVLAVAQAHRRCDPLLTRPGRLTYLNTSVEGLPAPRGRDDQYDVVTLFEVLEHIERPAAFLANILPHVRPGGWFVCSTIARTWTSWLTTKVVAEEVIRLVPRGTHEWSQYVDEEELRAWFAKQEGWGNPRAMGVVYVPGLGWREVKGSEKLGNYFFAVRKDE